MRIMGVDTLRLDEFPSLLYLLVGTAEGLTGLGSPD